MNITHHVFIHSRIRELVIILFYLFIIYLLFIVLFSWGLPIADCLLFLKCCILYYVYEHFHNSLFAVHPRTVSPQPAVAQSEVQTKVQRGWTVWTHRWYRMKVTTKCWNWGSMLANINPKKLSSRRLTTNFL